MFRHFACHGLANPGSIWEAGRLLKGQIKNGRYQQDHLMSSQVDAFADLPVADAPGHLVFLNACQVGRQGYSLTGNGGFARAFVNSGAAGFISTHWSVGDIPALDLSATGHKKLLEGEHMMTAVAAV